MSDESRPLKPSEFVKDHVSKGGFENDDAVLEVAGRAFFPEKCDPPASTVREVIPPGYVKAPEVAAYEEKRKEKDFDKVRERMVETLTPADAAAANSDYETFLFEYDRTAEVMRQEREEAEAKAKAARDKIEAHKNVHRKLMKEHIDPATREAAEVAYFQKFVQGGDR